MNLVHGRNPCLFAHPADGELITLQRQLQLRRAHKFPEQAEPMLEFQAPGLWSSLSPPSQAGCWVGAAYRLCVPPPGIQYLIEHKRWTPTIQDIAQFLYKGEGLNKILLHLFGRGKEGGALGKAGNE